VGECWWCLKWGFGLSTSSSHPTEKFLCLTQYCLTQQQRPPAQIGQILNSRWIELATKTSLTRLGLARQAKIATRLRSARQVYFATTWWKRFLAKKLLGPSSPGGSCTHHWWIERLLNQHRRIYIYDRNLFYLCC
jgi:hypothetical protein